MKELSTYTKEELQEIVSSWNGKDEQFTWNGEIWTEDDAHEAMELLEAK